MLLNWYPGCITCQKAKKWLDEQGLPYTARHIRDEKPTLAELTEWYRRSGLPLKRFFNTSGKLYAQYGLKDKLAAMSRAIQAVEVRVDRIQGKAKMSQNRHPDDVRSLLAHYEEHGPEEVADYLREVSLPHAEERFGTLERLSQAHRVRAHRQGSGL